ncbi:MAG: hypothetical protein AAFV80_21960, partial [Bacteroidota bacterium]
MKRYLIVLGIGSLLIFLFFALRGTPQHRIPIPEMPILETPTSRGQGRPIPYHEVLVGYRNWGNLTIIVYNDLNELLSDEAFKALDPQKIKAETQANTVVLNGPRFWVLDEIHGKRDLPRWSIQGHEYLIPAYIKLPLKKVWNRKPYWPMEVIRDTEYVYYSGTALYKLIDPAGQVYLMQAASREIVPDLE